MSLADHGAFEKVIYNTREELEHTTLVGEDKKLYEDMCRQWEQVIDELSGELPEEGEDIDSVKEEILETVKQSLAQSIKARKDKLSASLSGIDIPIVTPVTNIVKDTLINVGGGVKDTLECVGGELIDTTVETGKDVHEGLQEVTQDLADTLHGGLPEGLLDGAVDVVSQVPVVNDVVGGVVNLPVGGNLIDTVGNLVDDTVGQIPVVGDIVGTITQPGNLNSGINVPVVGDLLDNTLDSVNQITEPIPVVGEVTEGLTETVDNLLGNGAPNVGLTGGLNADLIDTVTVGVGGVLDTVIEATDDIPVVGEVTQGLGETVATIVKETPIINGEGLPEGLPDLPTLDDIQDTIDDAKDTIEDDIDEVEDTIGDNLPEVPELPVDLPELPVDLPELPEGLPEVPDLDEIKDTIDEVKDTIEDNLPEGLPVDLPEGLPVDLPEGLPVDLPEGLPDVPNLDEIKDTIDSWKDKLRLPDFNLPELDLDDLKDKVDSIKDKISEAIDLPDFEFIRDQINERIESIKEQIKESVDLPDFDLEGLKERLDSVREQLSSIIALPKLDDISNLLDDLKLQLQLPEFEIPDFSFESLIDLIRELLKALYEFIKEQLQSSLELPSISLPELDLPDLDDVKEQLESLKGQLQVPELDLDSVKDKLESIRDMFVMPQIELPSLGDELKDKIKDGLKDGVEKVVDTIADGIKDGVDKVADTIKGGAGTVIDNLFDFQAKDARLSGVKPLDLIGFIGNTTVSKVIRKLESLATGLEEFDFSHVGIVVTKDILPVVSLNRETNIYLEDGVHYILESTVSSGAKDIIDGKHNVGVQLRNLSEVLDETTSSVFHCKLINNPVDSSEKHPISGLSSIDDVMTKFSIFFHMFWKQSYTVDPISAMGLIFPQFRKIRKLSKPFFSAIRGKESQLCSELAARCYQSLGLISKEFNPSDVTPTDFCGHDLDGIPRLFSEPKPIYLAKEQLEDSSSSDSE